MGTLVDLAGCDLVVNSISDGATTPGQIGTPYFGESRVFIAKAVNFNATNTDNAISIVLPTGITRYVVASARICNASHSLSTATMGVFNGTGGASGNQTIAADQAITVTATTANTVNNAMSLTLTNANTETYTSTTLYARVGTAEGAAATGDVIINILCLS